VYESVREEYENHIPVYLNRITYLQQQLGTAQNETDKNGFNDEIIDLCKVAIDKIDQNELLRYFGEKYHESEENKKDYENQKSWIIDLLCNQGTALIDRHTDLNKSDDLTTTTVRSSSLSNELKSIYRSIQKWIDITDEKVN